MHAPAKNPVTTPILVQLCEADFNQCVLPYLAMSKRGPKCKIGYHRVFNFMLWVLYTGMQWKGLPVPKDGEGIGYSGHKHQKGKQVIAIIELNRPDLNLDGGFVWRAQRW